jgi:hypothetical protein
MWELVANRFAIQPSNSTCLSSSHNVVFITIAELNDSVY